MEYVPLGKTGLELEFLVFDPVVDALVHIYDCPYTAFHPESVSIFQIHIFLFPNKICHKYLTVCPGKRFPSVAARSLPKCSRLSNILKCIKKDLVEFFVV